MDDNRSEEESNTREGARAMYGYLDSWGPTPAEVDAWAAREHLRRQAWVNGPSDEEKRAWARYERRRRIEEIDEIRVDRRRREAELAREGLWSLVTSSPMDIWWRLVEFGREREELGYRPLTRSRIRMYDDDDLY
jgi:hypothetical protein